MATDELDDVTDNNSSAELTDSDYRPVQGFSAKQSKPPLRPGTIAILDKKEVARILNLEGHDVSEFQVVPLNFFPSPMDAFQYALYQFGVTDVYLVVMINKRRKSIYGHHVLDLTQEYSLRDDIVTQMRAQTAL